MTRADIARRVKVLRRAATRPRRPELVATTLDECAFDGAGAFVVGEYQPRSLTWKAARARVLEVHGPGRDRTRCPRPAQGGKLRPAPGMWWQNRFADLVDRRRRAEGAPARST